MATKSEIYRALHDYCIENWENFPIPESVLNFLSNNIGLSWGRHGEGKIVSFGYGDGIISFGYGIFYISDYDAADRQLKQLFSIDDLRSSGLVNSRDNLIFYKHRLIVPYIEDDEFVYLRARYSFYEVKRPVGVPEMIGLYECPNLFIYNKTRITKTFQMERDASEMRAYVVPRVEPYKQFVNEMLDNLEESERVRMDNEPTTVEEDEKYHGELEQLEAELVESWSELTEEESWKLEDEWRWRKSHERGENTKETLVICQNEFDVLRFEEKNINAIGITSFEAISEPFVTTLKPFFRVELNYADARSRQNALVLSGMLLLKGIECRLRSSHVLQKN